MDLYKKASKSSQMDFLVRKIAHESIEIYLEKINFVVFKAYSVFLKQKEFS